MPTHNGDCCPVAVDDYVWVDLGEGPPLVAQAGDLNWGPGEPPDNAGRILRYELIAQPEWLRERCSAALVIAGQHPLPSSSPLRVRITTLERNTDWGKWPLNLTE